MRKKGCLLLAALALLFAGCGEKTQKSAEDLQARYAQMQGYEAIVETAVPRGDETLHYTLSLEHSNGETRAAVLAPEELTGVLRNGRARQCAARGRDACLFPAPERAGRRRARDRQRAGGACGRRRGA